jgi:hypothetical protein
MGKVLMVIEGIYKYISQHTYRLNGRRELQRSAYCIATPVLVRFEVSAQQRFYTSQYFLLKRRQNCIRIHGIISCKSIGCLHNHRSENFKSDPVPYSPEKWRPVTWPSFHKTTQLRTYNLHYNKTTQYYRAVTSTTRPDIWWQSKIW